MSAKINDEFSDIKSKHTRWELRQQKRGFCRRCGKRKERKEKIKCDRCLKYQAKWNKKFRTKYVSEFRKLSHAGLKCERIK